MQAQTLQARHGDLDPHTYASQALPAVSSPRRQARGGKENVCYYCKQFGHWKVDCPKLKKDIQAKRLKKAETDYASQGNTLLQRVTLAELQSLQKRTLRMQKVAADPSKLSPTTAALARQLEAKEAHVKSQMSSLHRVFGKTRLGLAGVSGLESTLSDAQTCDATDGDNIEDTTQEELFQTLEERRNKHRADMQALLENEAVRNDPSLRKTIAQALIDLDRQQSMRTWNKIQQHVSVAEATRNRKELVHLLHADAYRTQHTPEHQLAMHKLFNEFDLGSKGYLDITDLEQLLESFGGVDVASEDLLYCLNRFDNDQKDGKLQFSEFDFSMRGTLPTAAGFVSVLLQSIAEHKREQYLQQQAKLDRHLQPGYSTRPMRGQQAIRTAAHTQSANAAFTDAGIARHNWELDLDLDLEKMTHRTLGSSVNMAGGRGRSGRDLAPELSGHAGRNQHKLVRVGTTDTAEG